MFVVFLGCGLYFLLLVLLFGSVKQLGVLKILSGLLSSKPGLNPRRLVQVLVLLRHDRRSLEVLIVIVLWRKLVRTNVVAENVNILVSGCRGTPAEVLFE